MTESKFYDLKAGSDLTTSMCSRVASKIGRTIVNGDYPPGTLVEDESALSNRYHVSRTVIRDAIKVLVGKGLLEVRRGIGTRVKPRKDWGLLDDQVLAWQLSAPPETARFLQLMEVRQVFEPQAARWAATRATTEEVAEIGAACDVMLAAIDDPEQFVAADARYHCAILRAAHNEFLYALEGAIYSTLLSSIRLTNPDRDANAQSVPFHRSVYEAILDKNETEAEQKMSLMLEDASRRIREMSPTD